jgi:hypothetical protein
VTAIAHVDDRRHLPVVVDRRGFQSPQHAAWQVEALRRARVVLDAAKAAVEGYADDNDGIPMGNGRAWSGRGQTRANVNMKAIDVAARLMAERSGRPVEDERAELVARVREAGGITESSFNRYETRRAG